MSKRKNKSKKWYAPIWSIAKTMYNAFTSNSGALIFSGVGLSLGIITGGTLPIAIATAALGVKIIKTGLDAQKTMATRSLDIENKALVDFVTALYVQQKTLELQPKLMQVAGSLASDDKSKTEKKITYNKTMHHIRQVVNLVNISLDIAGAATDPTKVIKAGGNIHNSAKSALEFINSTGSALASPSAVESLVTIIRQHPEAQEQLINFINLNRETEGTNYLDVQELRKQTRTIKIENQALVDTLQTDDFYIISDNEIQNRFIDHLIYLEAEKPAIAKPETKLQKIWVGIKDALNPLSSYNPEMQENSGLTIAIRKEEANKTIIMPMEKERLVTKDDLSLIKKNTKHNSTTSITISDEQREQDRNLFKADSRRIRKRLEKINKNIGNESHDKSAMKVKRTSSRNQFR